MSLSDIESQLSCVYSCKCPTQRGKEGKPEGYVHIFDAGGRYVQIPSYKGSADRTFYRAQDVQLPFISV